VVVIKTLRGIDLLGHVVIRRFRPDSGWNIRCRVEWNEFLPGA
jgi:hypothetical protein